MIHTLCTHSDTFHCDEVMAASMLLNLYRDIQIVRTRDPVKLEAYRNDPNVIVIDVGQVYDPALHCYDHHQPTFVDTFTEGTCLLSSCGLIYRHFGHQLISKFIRELGYRVEDIDIDYVYRKFYYSFIQSIDASDNGVDFAQEKLYDPIILPRTVASFNNDDVHDHAAQLIWFGDAVTYCTLTLQVHLTRAIRSAYTYKSEKKVFQQALEQTPDHLKRAGILVVDKDICLNSHLLNADPLQHYKFAVVPRGDKFSIKTVRPKGAAFGFLAPLISEEVAKSRYGDKVVFVHKALFTGAATDQATAIAIALDSSEQHNP
jgi:uncharacterized UPF0160 family protein